MTAMRIGFAKRDITPPPGTELGGYAGYRPCSGVHDPLHCKAVVLEQEGVVYALVALDLLCVDEALYLRIADALAGLGITRERLIVSAIHSHAAPRGLVPGEGPLAGINSSGTPRDPAFLEYIRFVIRAAGEACAQAVAEREPFRLRAARGPLPPIGSERHTGAVPAGEMTVLQFRTESGRILTLYNFPCHPTVLSAANLLVSADFTADVEALLGGDMAVFLNGAAGDVSTRFTRRESSFAECRRMGAIVAEQVSRLLEGMTFEEPSPLKGIHTHITLRARQVQTEEEARKHLEETTARWKLAQAQGADPAAVRSLKSYAEGAGVNLEFARTMGDLRWLRLPVTAFTLGGVDFITVPGELFTTLQPPGAAVIGYANGYYRYIGGEDAYDALYYEALAAIIARGQGEQLAGQLEQLLRQVKHMK